MHASDLGPGAAVGHRAAPADDQGGDLWALLGGGPLLLAWFAGPEHLCVRADPRLTGDAALLRAAVGRPLGETLAAPDRSRVLALFDRVLGTAEDLIEDELPLAGGAFVDLVLQPERNTAGAPVGVLALVRDVTQRARARLRVEAAARIAEQRLGAALDSSGIVAWDYDIAADQVRVWNSAQAWGIAAGRAADYLARAHPHDRNALRAAFEGACRDGGSYVVEYRVTDPDGSERWLESRASVQQDAAGRRERLLGVSVDITERRRLEAALRRSEAQLSADLAERERLEEALRAGQKRLRRALEAAGMVEWEVDLATGAVAASPRMAELYGYPADRPLTLADLRARYHPADRARLIEHTEKLMAAPESAPAEWDEFRIVLPDGSVRWIYSAGEFERDAAGRALRAIGIDMDVTERRGAEDALRENEERLRLALDAAALGTWDVDLSAGRENPVQRTVNGRFRELYGFAPTDEITGEACYARIHPEDRERVRAEVDRAMRPEGGGDYEAEYRVRLPDGGERWHLALARAFFGGEDGRRLQRMVGIVMDITDRRLAEARQRLLLQELAHRVKNTLAVIRAIAAQTGERAASVPEFLDSFNGRLQAMSAAHDLLSASGWRGADLETLVRMTLAPHLDDGRLGLVIQPATLGPAAAQNLALALHELATNAAKHGALSVPTGRALLRGQVEAGELVLVWEESGGPPVSPPTAQGFGTLMLGHALAYQHGGAVAFDWRPEGLLCRIRLPLGGRWNSGTTHGP